MYHKNSSDGMKRCVFCGFTVCYFDHLTLVTTYRYIIWHIGAEIQISIGNAFNDTYESSFDVVLKGFIDEFEIQF